jgi:hypothetical protein
MAYIYIYIYIYIYPVRYHLFDCVPVGSKHVAWWYLSSIKSLQTQRTVNLTFMNECIVK